MTVADTVRQPVTWLMTLVSLALLALSFAFGMFNFEVEDRIRMLATAGVAVAVVHGLFLTVVLVSQAIHDELASRTALTLFAKPLGRGTYLVGKALGVWTTVAATTLPIAGLHLGLLWLGWSGEFEELKLAVNEYTQGPRWGAVLAAHGFALVHGAVLACVAAVLALRLHLAANILTCFALFVLGHLLAGLGVMGAGVVPALALFNLDDHIQLEGMRLTTGYCLGTMLYSLLFCTGSLLVGTALFERQDIP
jgi:hypothetical protein